jgi:tRNA nucleotidyltransferase/poly(A) polymerase
MALHYTTDAEEAVKKGRETAKGGVRAGDPAAAAGLAVADALRRDRPLRRFLAALAASVSGAGGAVFLAGGYLRDIAEGKPGEDVDAMVAGLSHEALGKVLRALPFASLGIRKVVSAGKHFPVYRVATAWRGYVDIAAARGGGIPGAAPYARALEDASRRDFSINAMLYALSVSGNRLAGELLDPSGGIRDLARRTIRCVGKPEDRIREDPLRALRAVRMRNERRGFRIEPSTFRAARRLGPKLLPTVPADRLAGELLRSLSANPEGTLEDLRRSGILRALLPELSLRKGAVFRAVRRYRYLGRSIRPPVPPEILLANLLLDLPPEAAEGAARRLRFPDVRRVLRTLYDVRALKRPESMRYPRAGTEAILSRQDAPEPFLALYRAAMACDGRRGRNLKQFLALCSERPALVTGSDLVEIGFPAGPAREEALLAVREATLAGTVGNREEGVRSLKELLPTIR